MSNELWTCWDWVKLVLWSLSYGGFQLCVIKPKRNKPFWPITKDRHNRFNQQKCQTNSWRGRKRRQNWCEPVSIGFDFTSDLQRHPNKLKLHKFPVKQYKRKANYFWPSSANRPKTKTWKTREDSRESECSRGMPGRSVVINKGDTSRSFRYNNYITHSFDRTETYCCYHILGCIKLRMDSKWQKR